MKFLGTFHVTHVLMLLFVAGAVLASWREGLGLTFRRRMLLVAPLLAMLAAVVLIAYPTLADLRRPSMWTLAVFAGLAGVGRAWFMPLQVDNFWHVVRLHRAPDGLLATVALTVMAMAEFVTDLRNEVETAYHPTFELGMLLVASFLVGRDVMLWQRTLHQPHVDLRPQTDASRD